MDWYYKFLNWFKDKYGYDIWDKKFEGEEGKWSIGGILYEEPSINIKAENLFNRCLLLLTQEKLLHLPTCVLYASLQR